MLEDLKFQSILNSFLDYAKNNIKVELDGIETINGKDTYKIVTTIPSGKKTTHYYDKETSFKIREVNTINSPQGTFTQTIDLDSREEIVQAFADYRRDGFGRWPWGADDPVHPREQERFALHADGRRDVPTG